MSALSTLWTTISTWVQHPATKYFFHPIPRDHVENPQYVDGPLEAGAHYFRLWLTEMFLKNDRVWFAERHPAVHSFVRFQFGTKTVEIPYLAGEFKLQGLNANNLDRVIALNYPLTALMPFNGGVVELMAGLVSMKGDASLKSFIKVVEDFSGLLNVPQFSAALAVAEPVASGVQELLGGASGELRLGLHQTYTGAGGGGANVLSPGYIAVVMADATQLPKDQLWVVADRLQLGQSLAQSTPFTNYDYILLRVEGRTARDDMEGLTSIEEPRQRALSALAQGQKEIARHELSLAQAAAINCPELTRADRRRTFDGLKKEFEEMGGAGAVPGAALPLGDLVTRAMGVDQALALGAPTMAELP